MNQTECTHETPENAATDFAGYVPHEQLLACIHCGLCTSSCPTYLETKNENDSPRGRIHLMRAIEERRIEPTETAERHLELCLDCRSCETACPSGVKYGQLIETYRNSRAQEQKQAGTKKVGVLQKVLLQDAFTDRYRLERLLWPARMMQWMRVDRLQESLGFNRLLPTFLQRMQRMLPHLGAAVPRIPDRIDSPIRPARMKLGLFLGCVSDAMFRPQHWATARVLQRSGCDLVTPAAQGCCGAIDFHGGDPQRALERARINLEAFQALAVDHVVVNAAGCGAMLKEYDHLAKYDETLKSALNGFAHQVRDVHEVLSLLGPLPDLSPLPIRVVYQDACHLRHAQKIEQEPRKLLLQIPQLQLLAIAEPNICCGAAGSYNLTEPEMSDRLGQRKIEAILKQNPDVIASGNVGCSLQLQSLLRQRGLSIPVLHPVELIDMSQRGLTVEQYLAEVG